MVKTEYDAILDKLKSNRFRAINFRTGLSQDISEEGAMYWNDIEHTINLATGLGPVLQIGQEQYILAFNDTGVEINDGHIVRVNGSTDGDPTVVLAKADSPITATQLIGMATMKIPDQTIGIITTFGKVRGVDTSLCSPGDILYLSDTTEGHFLSIKPVYPNYVMTIGQCITSDADNGIVFIKTIGRIEDILDNGWNGGFLESINFTIESNETTITGTLENNNDTKNLTMNFSTGFEVLDTTTSPVTVTITPGADDNPQVNYVYVPFSTKTLTSSTSDWPSEQHIKVALVSVRTASTTQTDGALRNQNWNDHVADSNISMGHIQHIAERIRQDNAKWHSGAEGTLSITTNSGVPDNILVSNTSGKVYQLHRQTFPALDMGAGDDIHVVNDSVSPYKTITDLNSELTDASGGSLSNRHWSFVVWGIANKTGQTSHIMVNLPSNSYNTTALAQADPSNFSVYDIPTQFRGVAFLIARFTLQHSPSSGGTWILNATQDLRGFTPNVTAGGGGGGGGVSTFTGLIDTPNSYVSQANKFARVNASENAIELVDILSNIVSVTTTYTVLSSDKIIMCDGTFTVNLPLLSGFIGKEFNIKNISTGTITVDGSGSETIDDELTQLLDEQDDDMHIVATTSGWKIL